MSDRDMSNFSMMDLFRMEAETQVAVLNENILVLENNPNSPAELESLMRAAHSLKGAARIVGIDAAVQIAHVMEDCFVAAQLGTIALDSPEKIDIMLRAIDLLSRISQIHETEIENWFPAHLSEVESLKASILAIINQELDVTAISEPTATETNVTLEIEIPQDIALENHLILPADALEAEPAAVDPPQEILPILSEIESSEISTIEADLPMLALFSGEVEAQSILLHQSLQEQKNHPDRSLDIDSLIKAAHLIKGAGRIVQFDEVVKLARALEDTLVALQKYKASLNENQVDTLLVAVNFFGNMRDVAEIEIAAWLSERRSEIDNIVAEIDLISEDLKTQQAAITAAAIASQSTITPAPQPTAVTAASAKTTENNSKISPKSNAASGNRPQQNGQIVTAQSGITNLRDSATKSKAADRVVRVNAENLNRIMGLAGESLVEAKWLQPFADSLLKLRNNQGQLYNLLEKLQESLNEGTLDRRAEDHLSSARKKLMSAAIFCPIDSMN